MSANDTIKEEDVCHAMEAYGLAPTAIEPLNKNTAHATLYRVTCGSNTYLARVRSVYAQPEDILFAHKWASAVVKEVPVPVPLAPCRDVPRINQRCVDVAPYIAHEHTDAHRAGPQAWIQIGEWVGRIHRLSISLTQKAPIALKYGNHPHRQLMFELLDLARLNIATNRELLQRAEKVFWGVYPVLERHKPALPWGIIHGDMHFWNVLYERDHPTAIVDLDFLQQGTFLSDLAYASIWLRHWEQTGGSTWDNITERYLAAYEIGRCQKLSTLEKQCLPWARVWQDLLFVLQQLLKSSAKALADLNSAEELFHQLKPVA